MKPRTTWIGVVLVLGLVTTGAHARSFSIEKLHADVRLSPDGTARVTEAITYRFDGEFSYAYRNIPLRASDRVTDVQVSEEFSEYARSTVKAPGSFTVGSDGGDIVITWYYHARNETRTFHVAYTLAGAVTRHADVADVYYTVFHNETGASVRDLSTTVTLPVGVAVDDLNVFAHGPLHGTVQIVSGTTVTASVAPLPNRASFDVRILTPPDAFPAVAATDDDTREHILAGERELAAQADRQRVRDAERRERRAQERAERGRRARALFPLAAVLGAIAVAVWFAFFRANGWPHDVVSHAAPGDIPSGRPPALVSCLIARNTGGPALVATVVDLAERGYLTVTQSQAEKSSWFGRSSLQDDYRFESAAGPARSGLRPFENDLMEFMVNEVGDGRGFSMGDLKEYARKHRRAVQKWFVAWTKAVKEAAGEEGFFEPTPVSAMIINGAVGLLIMVAGAVICGATSSPAGVPALVGGFFGMILTGTLSRRTPEGQRELIAWKQFRDHLKHTAKARGPISLASSDWSRYMAAAIIFGMHKQVAPFLQVIDGRGTRPCPAWYTAIHTGGSSGVPGLADGFSSMVSTVTASVASSTGSGGGASGGGGGGAGGGGAGAG